jgi:IS4 transposase
MTKETCTFGLQEPSTSGGRNHGGRENNDHWTQDEFRRIVHLENNDHWTQDEIVHPDARRFWARFAGNSWEQGVCHKDSFGSYVRRMSNPITHITRILQATERSRTRKKREKKNLAPYKIYSLRHS